MSAGGKKRRLHDVVLSQLPQSDKDKQLPQKPEKIRLPVERIETPAERPSLPGLLPFFPNEMGEFANFITELFSSLAFNSFNTIPSQANIELHIYDGTIITATANINDIINKDDLIATVLESSGTSYTAADIIGMKILQVGLLHENESRDS